MNTLPTAAAERNWRRIGDFSEADRAVIRARHNGWEQATPALLAAVFLTTSQTINAILKVT